jgi:hypothetical protein
VKITWNIVADCDPPPTLDTLVEDAEDLCSRFEDEAAGFLIQNGAGFSIDYSVKVEP